MKPFLSRVFPRATRRLAYGFIERYSPDSLLHRLLVSKLGRMLFGDTFAVIQHWIRTFPALSKLGFIGAIDFVEDASVEGSVVRGWLFHYRYRIEEISLVVRSEEYRLFCSKLLRVDVARVFPALPNSVYSGFVLHARCAPPISSPEEVTFRVRYRDGESHQQATDGSFTRSDA